MSSESRLSLAVSPVPSRLSSGRTPHYIRATKKRRRSFLRRLESNVRAGPARGRWPASNGLKSSDCSVVAVVVAVVITIVVAVAARLRASAASIAAAAGRRRTAVARVTRRRSGAVRHAIGLERHARHAHGQHTQHQQQEEFSIHGLVSWCLIASTPIPRARCRSPWFHVNRGAAAHSRLRLKECHTHSAGRVFRGR